FGCLATWPIAEPDRLKRKAQEITLADLGVHPVDLVALASDASRGDSAEILRRVKDVILDRQATLRPDDIEVDLGAGLTTRLFLSDAIELARALGQVIGGARPLRPDDL